MQVSNINKGDQKIVQSVLQQALPSTLFLLILDLSLGRLPDLPDETESEREFSYMPMRELSESTLLPLRKLL